ncbi:hypothetical protein [Deinococcus multiflagellatus]|uniref:Uncharacterized protein n=1 Tax=Deinococcus multiflagellatus TaxID=1656887 RepID=A0ABW1ZEU8_9DEIO|nr:hypothetical protein [Deinococcus multiflagellatus]MBZ9712161.1 hypothetical protein [Deinococcus multiflagellatus]
MSMWELFAMFAAGTLTGGLLAGRYLSIKLYPRLLNLRDDAVAQQEKARLAKLDLSARRVELSSIESEAERYRERAVTAEAALESYLSGPDRERVVWLAQQLAAHLTPAGIASLVGRESARVDSEAQP